MRVVVMGGGVVGVTTAYQLLRDGHEVVLLERRSEVASGTSFGNAGMIAPGHSFAWSSPQAPMILLKSLILPDQALRFRPSLDPALWRWSALFLAQCTEARAARNTRAKHRIAAYSQSVLQETLAAESIEYDRNTQGILYFYASEAALERGVAHMRILAECGQEIRVLDRAGVAALEPALADARTIAGGIHCPTDETGDCRLFTQALAGICRARGVEIRTGMEITRIRTERGRVAALETVAGPVRGDAYVLSLGCDSPFLARKIGLRLPVYPVKGYSLTIPIGNHRAAPTMATLDEDNLVAISRFGERIRVTATAEIAGYDTSHRPADFAHMLKVVQRLFPDGADYARAEMWAGLRPMTPSNLPILGRSRYANLFLNTGHGHIGWTMSHGTARITADLIAGRQPAIPLTA
ncbi:MAG TPA: D-amino acid dehydrogenase [Acetobacteraceae bacterium]|nr:D-amino acid dehydrogenase [Acetobacteraceae bacterium]